MPVYVIDTLKPKNGLGFPVVEAVDVSVEGYLNLADAVSHFALQSSIDDIIDALDGKADTSALNTAATNLQAQIDQIVISSSAEAVVAPEVTSARVDANGKTHATLKARIDFTDESLHDFKEKVAGALDLDFEQGYYISTWNQKVSNEDFMISEPFYVDKGFKIVYKVRGYQTDVVVLAKTNSEGTSYTKIKTSEDSNFKYYEHVADESGYYCICSNKNFVPEVYIESTDKEISDINSKISEIDENFLGKQDISFTSGYYISNSGTKEANNDFEISDPIYFNEGDKITVKAKGYNTNVAIISKTNEEGTSYYPVTVSSDNLFKYYEYEIEESGYYAICTNVTTGAELYLQEKDAQLYERVSTLEGDVSILVENQYIPIESVGTLIPNKNAQGNKSGTAATLSGGDSSYSVREWNVEEGIEAVKIHCQASADTRYGVGFFCLTENNEIIYQFNANKSGTYDVGIVIPDGTYKIWANGLYGNTPTITTCSVQTVSKSYSKEEVDLKFADILPYTDVSLFSRIGVVGDSFASGELYYGGSYHDKYDISWGQILARKHGITCTNYSSGGLHTRSWLTSARGLALLNSSPEDDLYLLVLGINDYYALGREYLGELTDITNYDDPEEYGDTFYGNYGRIIESIMDHAPHAKIVMVTINSQAELPVLFSNAIIDIANYYEIPYIVQHSDPFFETETYTDMSGSHPTAIGYSGMACAFERLINRCMIDFHSYFRNAFMY